MNYFLKPKNEDNLSINLTENQLKLTNDQQITNPPLRKIILKKKNKKSLQEISDNIVQTESQHFFEAGSLKNQILQETNLQRDTKRKQKPFISFMGSQNESYQELQTPYLHGSSPNYNFGSVKMNIEAIPIEEVRDTSEKIIVRTKSKPNEQFQLQSPLNKNLGRRNSLKTQFQTGKKKLSNYPAELSSQQDDTSIYQRSIQGSKHRLTLKQNKEERISVLQDEIQEGIDNIELNQPRISQSTKLLLRKEQNQEDGYVNTKERMGRKSLNSNMNQFQSKLSAAIQSSESQTESEQHPQLTSRIQIPVQTYIMPKTEGYTSYIELQSRQLQQQQKRMNFYAEETNKLLCNVESYESSIKDQQIIDKQYHPMKYMFQELVELFCMAQVIKFQLRYRSYEIINKVYAKASKYYQQKILFEDPIKAYTFSLALKAILPNYEKSQLDIVIAKIFHSHHILSFQNFSQQLQPILNSKLVSLLQPDSMKKQLDRTLQKAKNLFVIWIEIDYFTKKIKQILRSNKAIYDSIMLQCTSIEEPSRLDMQQLQKYFLEGEKKNQVKRLKLDIFFRNTIGNDLLKINWSDWVYKQEVRMYNRYQGKAVFERLHFENRSDRRQTSYIKSTLTRKRNDGEQTSIMDTSRKLIPSKRNA